MSLIGHIAPAKSKSSDGLSMLEQLKAKAQAKENSTEKEEEEKQKTREKTTSVFHVWDTSPKC